MFKKIITLLVVSSLFVCASCSSSTGGTNESNESSSQANESTTESSSVEETESKKHSSDVDLTSNEAIEEAKALIWEEYLEELRNDEARKAEVDERAMTYGDVTMKYGLQVKGKADENGYPLYICLHGGGASDTPDVNDSQWSQMAIYYAKNVENGICVNPRGVRDTWDVHANPESFPLYDRLIENMVAFYGADPNRVYLIGFSAGGDGVYMITPKMADRFAGANMSAGHPNGVNLANLYNMPIHLQVGMLDDAYNRHTVTAEYDAYLDELAKTYGGGYIHKTFIHVLYGHNFKDNGLANQEVIADVAAWLATGDTTSVKVDTQATRLLQEYTREPLPEKVVWEFTNRAELREVESFYWLSASSDVTEGEIIASYDKATNTITIEKNTANGAVEILLNEEMVDLFAPITVKTADGSQEVTVTPDYEVLKETTYERGDYNYQFVAKIVIE